MLGDPHVQEMLTACGAPPRPPSAVKVKRLEPESYGPRGFIEPASLDVPGLRLIDAMCKAQDARERMERAAADARDRQVLIDAAIRSKLK
jgi:hypothetical protein